MPGRVLRHGRVLDEDGRPVAGAFVAVAWGTAPTPEIGRRTDASGLFQVALAAGGQFVVRATTTDGRAGEALVDGSATTEIVVRVAPVVPLTMR
jgi:protocatechuate 3,4-dioxygenase beta subunit